MKLKNCNKKVDIIPAIKFINFPDDKGGQYKYESPTALRIKKGMGFKWSLIIILHEFGHHVLTLVTRESPIGPVSPWNPNSATMKYEALWKWLTSKYKQNVLKKGENEEIFLTNT